MKRAPVDDRRNVSSHSAHSICHIDHPELTGEWITKVFRRNQDWIGIRIRALHGKVTGELQADNVRWHGVTGIPDAVTWQAVSHFLLAGLAGCGRSGCRATGDGQRRGESQGRVGYGVFHVMVFLVEQIEILILLESDDAGLLGSCGEFGNTLAEVVL